MKEKILIIDDEMYLEGNAEPRYGHLSERDLAAKIRSFFESQDFQVEFAKTGEAGLEIVGKDSQKLIETILLDIRFTEVKTKMQGPEIFREIKKVRSDLPIIVITILPTRKLPDQEDIFKEFVELGASLYIEKRYFTKRGQEQINYINAVAHRKDIKYTLRYAEGLDFSQCEILDVDILREDGGKMISILKNPYRINFPMSEYIEQCAENFPNHVHWKENKSTKEEMTDTKFHKSVHRLNDAIVRSSGGRVPALLERLGRRGCKLSIANVVRIESPQDQ